jgi:hypothetical protein
MMRDITGRDDYIIKFALTIALAAINRLPSTLQPTSDRRDMERILSHYGEEDMRARANRILDADEGFASLKTPEEVVAKVRAELGDEAAALLLAALDKKTS